MKTTITLLALIALTAAPAAAQKAEHINPPGLSKPAGGTYTHIVKVGKTLYIAGQIGVDAQGKVVGPGMREQVEQAYANVLTALKSQGANFSHVTKTTIYVTSVTEFRTPEVNAIRAKYAGAEPPANTLVQIQSLAQPEFKVEIEAVAVLP